MSAWPVQSETESKHSFVPRKLLYHQQSNSFNQGEGLNANKIKKRDSVWAEQQQDHLKDKGEEEVKHPVC